MTYTIVPADFAADRGTVLGLWEQNFPEASPVRYDWLYHGHRAAAWLLHAEDGAVGATGMMERTIRARGQLLRAAQSIDLNVNARHRTVSPAMSLQRAAGASLREGRHDLFYGCPNPQSEVILRRLGYRLLGNLHRWGKPLRIGPVLRAKVRRLLPRAAARLASPWLWIASRENFVRRPRGLHFEQTARFDSRFDRLWHSTGERLSFAGERTADYLAWRFGECPKPGHIAFCACRGDDLLAYLIYQVRDGFAYVSDFLFLDIADFDAILAEFLREARGQRLEAVVTAHLGADAVAQALRRYGFRCRPGVRNVYLCLDPKQPLAASVDLFDPARWHFTQADVDTEL